MRVLLFLALCLAVALASAPADPQCTTAECLSQRAASPSADAAAVAAGEKNETVTMSSNALIGSKVEGVWETISDFANIHEWYKEYSATKIIKGRGNVVGTIRETKFGRRVVRDKLTRRDKHEFKLHYSSVFRGDPEKNENELVWHSHEVAIELFPIICGGLASTFLRMTTTFQAPVSKLGLARARVSRDASTFHENLQRAAEKFKLYHGHGGTRHHYTPGPNNTQSLWVAYACPFQASANTVWQAAFPTEGDSLAYSAYFPSNPRENFAYRRMYHLPDSGRHGYGGHWIEDVLSVNPTDFSARVSFNFSEMNHHSLRQIHSHTAKWSVHRVHHHADLPWVDPNPQVVVVVENEMTVEAEDVIEHNRAFWTYFSDFSFRAIKNATNLIEGTVDRNKVTKRYSTLISFKIDDTVEMFSDLMGIQDIFTGFTGQDSVRQGQSKNRFEVRASTGPRPEDVKLLQYQLVNSPADTEGYVRTFRLQGAGHLHWMREWAVTIVLTDSVTSERRSAAGTFATVTLEYTPGRAYKPGQAFGDFFLMDPSSVIGEILLRHCKRHASIHTAKHRTLRVSAPIQSVMASLRANDSSWVPHSRGVLGTNRQGNIRWIDVSNYSPIMQTLLTLPNTTSAGPQGSITTQHIAFMFDPPHVFDSRVFIIVVSVRPVGAQQEASAVTLTNYLMHSYAYMHEPSAAHDLAHKYVSRVNDKLLDYLHRRFRAESQTQTQPQSHNQAQAQSEGYHASHHAANSFQPPAPSANGPKDGL